jgi:hypothetical protein
MGPMAQETNVQRTLERLRMGGYSAAAVGTWFGIPDVILAVLGPAKDFLLVAPCQHERQAVVVSRAIHCPELRAWLQAGGRFEVWAWAFGGHTGGGRSWQVVKRPVGSPELNRLGPDVD